MKLFVKIQLLLLGVVLWGLTGCEKLQSESPVPSIQFMSFVKDTSGVGASVGAGALLTISFKDGNGDVGAANANDSTPYLTLVFYGLNEQGAFVRYFDPTTQDSSQSSYLLPVIPPPVGKIKTETGSIAIQIPAPYWPIGPLGIVFHTIRFNIYLKDRAGNKSNVITTPAIQVP